MNLQYNVYHINNRELCTFREIKEELDMDIGKNYLFDLSYLGILECIGDKADSFLQGQLSADVRQVDKNHMIQSAQCNLKGRILSLIDLIYWNGYKCIVPKDILEQVQFSLTKTALLSRVQIQENSAYSILGFYRQNPEDIHPVDLSVPTAQYGVHSTDNVCAYHLGSNYFIYIIPRELANMCINKFEQSNQLLGSLTWHTLRLGEKQFEIYPESRGLFIPNRLGLSNSSYISFNKGCYKGQEIIARLHYRSTIKHSLKLYTLNTTHSIYSGQKIFDPDKTIEIGELIDYSIIDVSQYLIAVSILHESPDKVLFEGAEGNFHTYTLS